MYIIFCSYKNREKEAIDETDTMKDAKYLVAEYAMAYGPDFRIWTENA